MLFKNPSPVNTASNEHQKTGLKQFTIPTGGHILACTPVPGWYINRMPRCSNMPSTPNHSPPPSILTREGTTQHCFSEVSLLLRSLESQALLFTTALNSSSLLAGRNGTFVSKAVSSSFPDIISDFSSNKGRLTSYFENPTIYIMSQHLNTN